MAGIQYESMTGNVPRGDYAGGNYALEMADGSSTKVFRNFIETMGIRYSANDFTGRSMYNMILNLRNYVFSSIGDSTNKQYLQDFTDLLGALNLAKVIYYRYSTSNNFFNVEKVTGLTPTAAQENGLKLSTGAWARYPGNSDWTDPDLMVELRFSGHVDTESDVYIFTKWGTITADKSFQFRLDGADLRFTWFDGAVDQAVVLTGLFTGAVLSSLYHIRIRAVADDAGFFKIYADETLDDGLIWTQVFDTTGPGTTTFQRSANRFYNINNRAEGAGGLTKDIKVHKAIVYNGTLSTNGDMITPSNIEQWDLVDNFATSDIEGSIPTVEIYDGGIGGFNFANYDATLLASTTVPDVDQLMLINIAHNEEVAGTRQELRDEIDSFMVRLLAQIPEPNFIIDSQNPEKYESTIPFRNKLMAIKSDVLRSYAMEKSYGLMDTYTAYIQLLDDWENNYMADEIHPNLAGYLQRAYWLLSFITGR